MRNYILIAVGVAVLLGGVFYFLNKQSSEGDMNTTDQENTEQTPDTTEGETDEFEPETVIGTSVESRNIVAYHYGTGDTELLFIGGIHGGYSWNTSLVAYELMDYLAANPENIPDNVTVTVIPVMNPDGLEQTVGTAERFSPSDVPSSASERIAGRFNANNVDLNRNFECDWSEESMWQSQTVSGGSAAFSEPESAAVRDYVNENDPHAVVVWYSAAGGVFASNCHKSVLPETAALTNLYAQAAGYRAYESFDFYDITGDMVNWMAKEGIPAVSVLLTTHDDVEWEKNRAGVEAMFELYGSDEEETNEDSTNE
ncbi:MAG: M14 family metallopeptidase [Candidatus Paceibacterota bacterium]